MQAHARITASTASHHLWRGEISFPPCPLCWDYAGSAWARLSLRGSQQSFHLRTQEPRFWVKVKSKALPAPSPYSLLSEAQNCRTGLLLETDPQGSCWRVWGPQQRCRLGWELGPGSTHLWVTRHGAGVEQQACGTLSGSLS